VEPGEDMKSLKAELAAKLNGLKDDENAATAINKIFDQDELPSGPYLENGPDFFVGYNDGYRVSWDSVTGKVNNIVFDDNRKAWSGDHCIDPRIVPGIFFCNQRINAETVSIMDIAPTALELFGLQPPRHMDGNALIDTKNLFLDQKGKKNE